MGIHLKQNGFSLLVPPKCGSTSLKHLAFEIENGRPFRTYVHNGQQVHIHQLYPSLPFEKEQQKLGSWDVFAVVREPVERIVSCHSNRVLAKGELDDIQLSWTERRLGLCPRPDLENFVRHLDRYAGKSPQIWHHSRALSHFLGSNLGRYTQIFDLRNLDRLLDRIRDLIGRDLPKLAHKQRSGWLTKPSVVPEGVHKRIKTRFAEDYAIFGQFFAKETVA